MTPVSRGIGIQQVFLRSQKELYAYRCYSICVSPDGNVRYWEIWNEPDIGRAMWTGTQAEFFRLCETAARAIKKHDPQPKVGGPALANVNRDYMEPFLNQRGTQ